MTAEMPGQLAETLRGQYGELGISGLREIGHGLDARVFRAESAALGPVAIRVPHARWLTSGNETKLDSRLLLRQEERLSQLLRTSGVPVPAVFVLHTEDEGLDFTISRYVEADGGPLGDADFGRLIRAVHELPAPPFGLVCMESRDDLDEVLAERIASRLAKLTAVTGVRFGPGAGLGQADIATALAADAPGVRDRVLLHMDLRPENVLVRAGRAVALIDWSNALAGDPALDLARAAEYGTLTAAALAGYGEPGNFTLTPTTPRQFIYRLDTAVMLSHVFLNDAPDPARARHYLERTRELCRLLTRG